MPFKNRSLRYLWHLAHNPAVSDFTSEGLGIEARFERCREFWKAHLELSKKFQRDFITGGNSVAVLGAGRLLDVPTDYLQVCFKNVHLFDADPGAVATWRDFAKRAAAKLCQVHFHTVELTGTLQDWTTRFERHLKQGAKDPGRLAQILSELPRQKTPPGLGGSYDVIISLNLLSQIPIYWRERALKYLRKYTTVASDDDFVPDTLKLALDQSQEFLQRQHLAMLEQSGASQVILITDTEFLYYVNSHAEWQAEPAMYFSGLIDLKRYRLTHQDSWLWHIAPQGVELSEYGIFHKVEAFAFSLSN